MISNSDKSTLWSVLEKYDNLSEYKKFCNSLSSAIQNKLSGDDILTIYTHSDKIDRCDYKTIDKSLGVYISNYLFSI